MVADSRMKELRCGRMEINRFNVVLEMFKQFCFDFIKVFTKLDPTVAGACRTRQSTDHVDFTAEWLARG